MNKMFDRMKYCSILAVMLLLALPSSMSAQTEINVGKTRISFHPPVRFAENTAADSLEILQDSVPGRKIKSFSALTFGFGGVAQDMIYKTGYPRPSTDYGFDFEVLFKQMFKPASWYGFGVGWHFSAQTYSLHGVAASGIIKQYPENADIYKEFLNYCNIGIDIVNRFYLYGDALYLDLRLFGDWAFIREFDVKYVMPGSAVSTLDRFKDGSRFLPFQAGVEASLGSGSLQIYFRYRFTNMFNHSLIPLEPERLSAGIKLEFN